MPIHTHGRLPREAQGDRAIFGTLATSPLEVEVKADGGTHDFQLKH